MRFRFRAFALHLLGSATALTLVLGSLYIGWYHWPGWYLAGAIQVVLVLAGVDVALGPLLTLVIASPAKPRRALARDVSIIVVVQLCALVYGAGSLWAGRPLYYAFSENELQLVQAYDLDAHEVAIARGSHLALAPHWYSLPRWIWAPLPADEKEADRILSSAIRGGADVISMPRYFKPWNEGLPELRKQLKRVDDSNFFWPAEKKALKQHLQDAGLATDQPNTLPLAGRGRPLLVVFDLQTLKISGIFKIK
jgi:hypothetical protein